MIGRKVWSGRREESGTKRKSGEGAEVMRWNWSEMTRKRGGGSVNYGVSRTAGRLKKYKIGLAEHTRVTVTTKSAHPKL